MVKSLIEMGGVGNLAIHADLHYQQKSPTKWWSSLIFISKNPVLPYADLHYQQYCCVLASITNENLCSADPQYQQETSTWLTDKTIPDPRISDHADEHVCFADKRWQNTSPKYNQNDRQLSNT